jgi:hypothetical protein
MRKLLTLGPFKFSGLSTHGKAQRKYRGPLLCRVAQEIATRSEQDRVSYTSSVGLAKAETGLVEGFCSQQGTMLLLSGYEDQ